MTLEGGKYVVQKTVKHDDVRKLIKNSLDSLPDLI